MQQEFPHEPGELTREHLTRLVQTLHPEVEVIDFEVWENKTFAAGTDDVSTAGRIGVDVVLAGDGAESINTRWVLKVCRPDLGDIPLYENEVNFYTRLAPEIESEIATCFGGQYSRKSGTFGIALEDLRQRDAEFANVTTSVSLAQIRNLLSTLAALHARYWQSPRFEEDLAWVQPHTSGSVYTMFNHPDMVPAMISELVETNQFKKELVEAAGQTAEGLYHEFRKLQRHQASLPQTLCHGDTHIGNTYLLPDGNVGLLDWQLLARGYCLHDVTYLLMTGLSVGLRREHEKELLAFYRDQLLVGGVQDAPSPDTMWLEYRRAAVWGVYIGWLTTPINNYGWEITVNNHIRLLTAYQDLESSAALAGLREADAFSG
ncbi:ecdysteroid 22-kinase family protein [Myxococcota bacterium]|nr:ecdysteroid 22-kinase family protein [Myxococcota bacterium]